VLASYWWQGVLADVTDTVANCEVCDRTKTTFNTTGPQLQSLPITGLFYRWGVDLCGPFPTSRHGNSYIMVAVEHYSRTLVLVPIPSKHAKYTAFAFEQAVLGRFGSCGEVVTDQGSEWLGEFQECLARCFIDHRTTAANHPQSNGLTERCVQTVKRCLRRHCEDTYTIDTWDEKLPYISLGYNCSKQASTKRSPFELLYARDPFVPSAVRDRMAPVLDFDNIADSATLEKDLIARAGYLSQAMPTIASNLAIAQQRDQLRYQRTRSGSYLPSLRKFSPGDYVYLRRPNLTNTLQINAQQLILRVLEVGANGVVLLQGRCGNTIRNNVQNLAPCHLPNIDGTIHHELARTSDNTVCERCNLPDDEAHMCMCDTCGAGWHTYCMTPSLDRVPNVDFICENCIKAGITQKMLHQARAGRKITEKPDMNKLFPDASMRARDKQAESYHGRYVSRKQIDQSGSTPSTWGTVIYRGPDFRPQYFTVHYDDGTKENLSMTKLKNRQPLPAGSARPAPALQAGSSPNALPAGNTRLASRHSSRGILA
jgi:hypothetical protein